MTEARMKPLKVMSDARRMLVHSVFTDIDDTLTTEGRLTAIAYNALERLQKAGKRVVLVTGRPAGWCDHMARMWPVDGVVGENGAFCFRYDHDTKSVIRHYARTEDQRAADRKRLNDLCSRILAEVPGSAVASDQAYREADLAIDFCEDVPALEEKAVNKIARLFADAGATAKISSIHVNGWFGSYDKLSMSKTLVQRCFGQDLEKEREFCIYAGDSPNDAPMFSWFPLSVGVANVRDFEGRIDCEPTFVTEGRAGEGFTELVDFLLQP
jgi:HAD superfamily hydrolase (TIGR01484 family)